VKNNLKLNILELLISLAGALVIGLAIAVFSPGTFLTGWVGAGVISLIVVFALLKIWRGFGAGRTIGIIMLVTLVVRIGFGIFSYAALPVWGYDTPTQNAGFLYSDAQGRDFDAYDIAQRKSPLYTAFTNLEATDQYGGMMFLSALVYRTLSPDVSRPLLIALLAAFAMAAGVAFLYAAIRLRWSEKIAVWDAPGTEVPSSVKYRSASFSQAIGSTARRLEALINCLYSTRPSPCSCPGVRACRIA